ncbi:DUF2157 domain-containing protein [Shewanella pneumatophori]|uniref:DUF2157 domain-containing protein n=1 Tax=Shewanella pneumatophori TaxID=314092 RepID=A0A9X1Z7T1_9GAMM|nr:DUF2157 domain-containing protein [Shewanella pneumatophori]
MANLKPIVIRWFEQGFITKEALPAALHTAQDSAESHASTIQWHALITLLLTWGGALLVGAGVVFFVAANWQVMGQFSRFALVEMLLLTSLLGYILVRRRAVNAGDISGFGYTTANAILLLSAIIIGSLLALVGQTYQTGADPWQLFAIWALLMLPLALVAGNELLWLLLGLLLNLAVLLYFQAFPGALNWLFGPTALLAWLFFLNLSLHLACSLLSGRFVRLPRILKIQQQRFNAPLFQQITMLAAVGTITILAIESLFDEGPSIWGFVYTAVIAAGFFVYNHKVKDIFVLAIGGYSLVTVVNCLFIRVALEGSDVVAMFLLLGISIIGSTTGVTLWLKQRHKAFNTGASA